MKIAKSRDVQVQKEISAILNNYYLVEDDYDFAGNNAEDVSADVVAASVLKKYLDISAVEGWENLIGNNDRDYIYMRDYAKSNFLPIWADLSPDDRKILIKYYIYSPETTQDEIDAFYTVDEQLYNWEHLAAITKTARALRWETLRKRVSFDLSKLETLMFYQDTKDFKYDYIDANLPYLPLWLTDGISAELNIDFSLTGFSSKSYYTVPRRDLCIAVLIKGIY